MNRKICLAAAAVFAGLLAVASPATAQKFSSSPSATPPAADPAATQPQAEPEEKMGVKLPSGLYDETLDGAKQIKEARERAKLDNRRVLVMWGENKCEFCVHLHRLLHSDPQIKQLVETEFDWIKVDIGKFDKHIDLAQNYNVPLMETGFGAPAFCVIDPVSNQSVGVIGGNAMVAKPMTMTHIFDEKTVLNFLSGARPRPQVASQLMIESQTRAKRESKPVLVYFSIYGSDASALWDKVMGDSVARPIVEKAFLTRKIDVDRHIQGWDTLKRLKESQAASPPWMTTIDGEGKVTPEAGKGVAFDPMEAGKTSEWLVAASKGKLSAEDAAALNAAIARLSKPAEEPKKEEAQATPAEKK